MTPQLLKFSKPIACIAALILAFAAGRFARPTKVETHSIEDTQKRDEQKTENKKTDEVTKTKNTDQIKKHTTITKKDGTKIETDTIENKKTEKQVEIRVVDRIVDRIVYQDRWIEKTKIVENAKTRLHVGPDVSVNPFKGNPSAVFGGHVEVRTLGPVWVGVRANTRGEVTLGLSLEF